MKSFFEKLFGRKKESQQDDNLATTPLTEAQIKEIVSAEQTRHSPPLLLSATHQSVGKQRELNEDTVLTFALSIGGQKGAMPFGLYIVADGMGGHQYGEVASNAAARTFAGYVIRKMHSYFFDLPTTMPEESLQEIMLAAVAETQRIVQREAPGGGTTLTAAMVIGQQVTLAHVGDSRAYQVYDDGRITPLTRDHSLVRRLEELGQLTAAEAAEHPQRNVLYRAIGQGEILEPDVQNIPFPKEGYLMLCSDGLWGVVSDDDMQAIIANSPSLEQACVGLVNAANAAGGPDNISVVLVKMLS